MTTTPQHPGAFKVRAKTSEVKQYHYDDAKPGKPLNLLIPGGLIALASIGLIIYIIYATWIKSDGPLPASQGLPMILLLAPFYIGGVYMFSYGYELYDQKKALRLTAIIVFVTVAFVVIIAVFAALLKGGSSSSSDSDSSSSSGSSSSSSSGSGGGGHLASPPASSTSHSGGGGTILDPIIFVGGNTRTVTETREVIKEVPIVPMPITCPSCGRSYVPADNQYACPNCGTATPQELIDQSQAPSA